MANAAGLGYLAVVERLLQEKADVNAAAAGYGRLSGAGALHQFGSSLPAMQETPDLCNTPHQPK
jgi:hypothetical protein